MNITDEIENDKLYLRHILSKVCEEKINKRTEILTKIKEMEKEQVKILDEIHNITNRLYILNKNY